MLKPTRDLATQLLIFKPKFFWLCKSQPVYFVTAKMQYYRESEQTELSDLGGYLAYNPWRYTELYFPKYSSNSSDLNRLLGC